MGSEACAAKMRADLGREPRVVSTSPESSLCALIRYAVKYPHRRVGRL
jgi:hypothetical protein